MEVGDAVIADFVHVPSDVEVAIMPE